MTVNGPHVFSFRGGAFGTPDRDCDVCGKPDRDPVHIGVVGGVVRGPNDLSFYQEPKYRQVSTERQRIRYPALSAAADNHPDGYYAQRFAQDLLRLAQDVLETLEIIRAEGKPQP